MAQGVDTTYRAFDQAPEGDVPQTEGSVDDTGFRHLEMEDPSSMDGTLSPASVLPMQDTSVETSDTEERSQTTTHFPEGADRLHETFFGKF